MADAAPALDDDGPPEDDAIATRVRVARVPPARRRLPHAGPRHAAAQGVWGDERRLRPRPDGAHARAGRRREAPSWRGSWTARTRPRCTAASTAGTARRTPRSSSAGRSRSSRSRARRVRTAATSSAGWAAGPRPRRRRSATTSFSATGPSSRSMPATAARCRTPRSRPCGSICACRRRGPRSSSLCPRCGTFRRRTRASL